MRLDLAAASFQIADPKYQTTELVTLSFSATSVPLWFLPFVVLCLPHHLLRA